LSVLFSFTFAAVGDNHRFDFDFFYELIRTRPNQYIHQH
jgi:hypothetical protein